MHRSAFDAWWIGGKPARTASGVQSSADIGDSPLAMTALPKERSARRSDAEIVYIVFGIGIAAQRADAVVDEIHRDRFVLERAGRAIFRIQLAARRANRAHAAFDCLCDIPHRIFGKALVEFIFFHASDIGADDGSLSIRFRFMRDVE